MDTQKLSQAQELLEKLIAIPSFSRNEESVADALQQHIEECGIECYRSGNNVWCVSPAFDEHKPTLLLNSHLDTVKPVAGWQHDPFKPTLEGERLYGLGSNDAGGCVVSLLETFRTLTKEPQPYNLIFLASCEEEVSGTGGVEAILPKLPPITCAIVGEPTGMQPAIAEKGLMVVEGTAHGKSGHAAREEGINALYIAIEDIEKIRNYTFEKVSPLLGPVKATVTMIEAGTQHNVVPDRCSFVIDVRSNEFYSNQEIFHTLQGVVTSSLKERSFRLNSSKIDTGHPLVRRAIALGKQPYGSPTLSDQCLMPFPTLKMGPGESSRSHTADEYITLPELEQGLQGYLELLDGLVL